MRCAETVKRIYRWMSWKAIAGVCLITFGPCLYVASGQSDLAGIEQSLKGQALPLRCYSADRVVNFTWTNGRLVHRLSKLNTLGVFTTRDVEVKHGILSIRGVRGTIVRNGNTNELGTMGREPMVLNINLRGAKPEDIFPELKHELFFASVNEAIHGLPASVTHYLPYTVLGSRPAQGKQVEVFDAGKWLEIARSPNGLSEARPSIIRTEPAHMVWEEDAARLSQTKVPDTAGFVFFVSEDGSTGYVWLAKPGGARLEKNALAVLADAQFTPAEYGNHYVGMEMAMEFAPSGGTPGYEIPRSCHETGILTYNCGFAGSLMVSPSTLVWNDLQDDPATSLGSNPQH